ncbi:MAG: ABC transporter substrate-binding protein [Burkholderiales bacterium RIFCSPHIGHO2_12_FULL_69_20]|nr:MAG: ABC transporter substrate-binding protein [Burkholderiales bacterium RIFCSPHIGHO2_12_FULL_69_20]
MLKLARAITRLNLFIGKWVALLILPMFVMLVTDVAMRYLVGRPAVWTTELTQLVFGFYAVIGGGWLLAERAHVNVDIFYGGFPRRRKALVDALTSVLFFLFLSVLIWQGSSMAWESAGKLETSQSTWNPQIWPVKLAIPVAGLLLLLQGIVRLVSDIRVLMGLPNEEAVFGKQASDQPAH